MQQEEGEQHVSEEAYSQAGVCMVQHCTNTHRLGPHSFARQLCLKAAGLQTPSHTHHQPIVYKQWHPHPPVSAVSCQWCQMRLHPERPAAHSSGL
jgi:hypothetical protein